jgi:hypothetical protein
MKTKINIIKAQFMAVRSFEATFLGASMLFAASAILQASPQALPSSGTLAYSAAFNTTFASLVGGAPALNFVATTGVETWTPVPTQGNDQGTFQEWVYKDVTTQKLDFFYQFTFSSPANEAIDHTVALDFFNGGLNWAQLSPKGFVLSDPASLPGAVSTGLTPISSFQVNNSVLDFNYDTIPVNPGQTSVVFGVTTTADRFAGDMMQFRDGGTSQAISFVPVPEPTATLFGIALLGVVGVVGLKRFSAAKMPQLPL